MNTHAHRKTVLRGADFTVTCTHRIHITAQARDSIGNYLPKVIALT